MPFPIGAVVPATLLASSLSCARPSGDVALSKGTSASPRVLFTIDGEDYDHLGRGLLGLPDIDRDGTSDLCLSALGHALACSGKDGCVIYRLETPEDTHPDPLPRHPALVDDLNGDGLPDFSLEGESSFHDPAPKSPWVLIHSSATGSWIAKYGGEPFMATFAMFAGRAIGSGDLDDDGRPEILVETWKGTYRTLVYTLGSDVPRAHAEGTPLGTTPDVDGDRVRDVLTIDGIYDEERWGRIVSGSDGRVLSQWELPLHAGILRELSGAGDVDGDGFPDVVSVFARPQKESWWPPADPGFDCDLVSGLDGSVIHSWGEELREPGHVRDAGGLDDLNGDGIREVFVATCDGHGPVHSRVGIYSGVTRELVCELTSEGMSFGFRVCSAGDLDGDRIPEILVGEPGYGRFAGRVWVYSLGPSRR